jgi:hypothetical protein
MARRSTLDRRMPRISAASAEALNRSLDVVSHAVRVGLEMDSRRRQVTRMVDDVVLCLEVKAVYLQHIDTPRRG